MAVAKTSQPKISSQPSTTKDPPARASIIERIHKPSADLRRVGVCIYGRGGVGKTTLLGTMPGKGLIIDVPQVEGGTSVLSDKADKIEVLPVVQWNDLDEAYRHLKGGDHEYKWSAIDTIGACQELAKRKVISERDLNADPHTVSMQEWGKIGQLMAELFYKFRLLPMNTILLAQEKSRELEEGGREYQPAVSPMSLEALLPPQHLVARLYVWQTQDDKGETIWERRLRTAPHQMYLTKARNVRGRELPPVINEPHLGQILAYMLGEKVRPPQSARDENVLDLALE